MSATNLYNSDFTQDLEFFLITSPMKRSGATLVQRLLCSAKNTLAYGENASADVMFAANFVTHKSMMLTQSKPFLDKHINDVLNGNNDHHLPDLIPEVDYYLDKTKAAMCSPAVHLKDYAAKHGRNVWGIKESGWQPANMNILRMVFPKVKFIYITRNLVDVAKSAKAMELYQDNDGLRQLCEARNQNLEGVRKLPFTNEILFIDYDHLVNDTASVIKELEAHTGAEGIDVSVMNSRRNVWEGDQRCAPMMPGYLPPQELTDEELAIVNEYVGTPVA